MTMWLERDGSVFKISDAKGNEFLVRHDSDRNKAAC